MRSVAEVKADILASIHRGEHEMEAGYPYENPLNDLQRDLIAAYAREHGHAWLGKVNLYKEDKGRPVMWEWDGAIVLNFGARFVVPCFSLELVTMILERANAEYTGTAADYERVKAIHARIHEMGGELLIWN
jgi:hypothetical protein